MAAGLAGIHTPITMTVWDNDTTDEGKTWTDGVIAQFEAAHAGVAVEVQRVQNEDFDGRLLTPSAVVEAISLYDDDPFASRDLFHREFHCEQIGAVVDRVITPDDPRWTTLRFPAAPFPPQAAMAGTFALCRRPCSGEPHQPSSPSARSTRSLT